MAPQESVQFNGHCSSKQQEQVAANKQMINKITAYNTYYKKQSTWRRSDLGDLIEEIPQKMVEEEEMFKQPCFKDIKIEFDDGVKTIKTIKDYENNQKND